MSAKDRWLNLAELAVRLEDEGAQIVSARADEVAGSSIQLWAEDVPEVIRERAGPFSRHGGYTTMAYDDAGITVFWLEEQG